MRKYYRIPRKQKKKEKANLVFLTNLDIESDTTGKYSKVTIKQCEYSRWVMAGVYYHKYNWKK
jgi:hypothetical protein